VSTSERKNVAASVRQRLLNLARQGEAQDFQRLLVRYAIERFLYRISQSSVRDRFVLKGANLFAVWAEAPFRSTGDLDLLGFGPNDVESMRHLFSALCDIEVADDGLVFDAATIRIDTLRDEDEYQGVRVRLLARLTSAEIGVQIDIGFGDVIHPGPQEIAYPRILQDFPAATVRAYPPETVIAEKFEAMVRFDELASRLKDHFDIWVLSRTFAFELEVLQSAIFKTFTQRGTVLPVALPPPLTARFAANRAKLAQWSAFLVRTSPTIEPPSFGELVEDVASFLGPTITGVSGGTWSPGGGWRFGA